jgi:hypothetical protein
VKSKKCQKLNRKAPIRPDWLMNYCMPSFCDNQIRLHGDIEKCNLRFAGERDIRTSAP